MAGSSPLRRARSTSRPLAAFSRSRRSWIRRAAWRSAPSFAALLADAMRAAADRAVLPTNVMYAARSPSNCWATRSGLRGAAEAVIGLRRARRSWPRR